MQWSKGNYIYLKDSQSLGETETAMAIAEEDKPVTFDPQMELGS